VTRTRVVFAAVFAAVAVLGVGGTGVAWALWSDSHTDSSVRVATEPQVGVSFSRVGSAGTAATDAASVLDVAITRADGQALLAASPRAVAVPLAVRLRADGHAGITYSLAVPAFAPGTLFAASTIRLFPVTATTDAAAQAACTPAAAPPTQPSTTAIVGIAAGVDPAAPDGLAVDYWCLTAVYSGTGGDYANTATAQGTAPSGVVVQAQDTWQTFVIAPADVSLTHTLHLPGGP
jgi:hypothetical protein